MALTYATESKVKKSLPIGRYYGKWSGYEVKVNHDGEEWFLKTNDGVRGLDIDVEVRVRPNETKVITL
jgi:hypothetical protein